MIRRTAAKAILILAGILFLAHAVVPHHHHGNLICFVKSHCDNDGTGNDHGNTPDNHNHDCENGTGHCVLKDPVIVSSGHHATGLKFIEKKFTQSGDDNLQNSLPVNVANIQAHDLQKSFSSPPVKYFYNSLASASLGLRAPPAV